MQMELENPFCLDFSPQLTMDGNPMHPSHGCGAPFHPCPPMETCNAPEAESVVRHYDLDTACGWSSSRFVFPDRVSRYTLPVIRSPLRIRSAERTTH